MDPYRPMIFDNRPVAPVFLDSNPVTDGVANFAAALMNAGPAANQIREQRAAAELAKMWKDREWERQQAQDKLAALWHQQAQDRQITNDERLGRMTDAQIANLEADNARANLEGLSREGRGWVDSVGKLFRGGGGGGNGNKVVRLPDGSTVMVDKNGNKINDIGGPKAEKQFDLMTEYSKAQRAFGIDPDGDQTENDKTIIANLVSLGNNLTPAQKKLLEWLQQKYQNSPSVQNTTTEENTWAWPVIAGVGGIGAIEGAAYLANKGKPGTAIPRKPVTTNVNPAAKTVVPSAAPSGVPSANATSVKTPVVSTVSKVIPSAAAVIGVPYFLNDAWNADSGIEKALSTAGAAGSGFQAALPWMKSAATPAAGISSAVGLPLTIAAAIGKSAIEHEYRDRDTSPQGILIDYGMGRVKPYTGTSAGVTEAILSGNLNSQVDQAKMREDELLHAIGLMLPEPKTPQQAAQREQTLRNFKMAIIQSSQDDASLLQGMIQQTFPWVTDVNRRKIQAMSQEKTLPPGINSTPSPGSMNGLQPNNLSTLQKINRLFTGQ